MQIVMAVGVERARPRLPRDGRCPRGLRGLIKSCWQHVAAGRPSFLEIRHALRSLARDAAAAAAEAAADRSEQAGFPTGQGE